MSVPFSLRCPKCKTKLTIKKESLVGKKAPCPKCKTKLLLQPPEAKPPQAPKKETPADADDDIGFKSLEDEVGLKSDTAKVAAPETKTDAKPVADVADKADKAKSAPVKAKAATKDKAVAKAKKKPSKKKKVAAPEEDDDDLFDDFEDAASDGFDDFDDDDFDDDDDFEDEPVKKKGKKGKAAAAKKPAKKSAKKSKSGSKGLIIAVGLLGAALAGGATWFLWPPATETQTTTDSGNGGGTGAATASELVPSPEDIAGTDNADAGNTGANAGNNDPSATGATGATGSAGMSANGQSSDGLAAGQNRQAVTGAENANAGAPATGFREFDPANAIGAATAATAGPAAFDVSYLPLNSELFVRFDVESIHKSAPVQMVMKNASVAANVRQLTEKIGLEIHDVKTVTMGVGDVQKTASMMGPMIQMGMAGGAGGRPPEMEPGQQPDSGLLVVRLNKTFTSDQLKQLDPSMNEKLHAGQSYLTKLEDGQVIGVWFPKPETVIFGSEQRVKSAIEQGSALPNANLSFVNADANILICFVPKEPDVVFRSNPDVTAQVPIPMVKSALDNLVNETNAFSIGINLETDIGLVASILCKTPTGAENAKNQLQELLPMASGLLAEQKKNAPVLSRGYFGLGESLLSSMKLEEKGNTFQLAGTSTSAGTTLGAWATGMLGTMMPALQQARGAARRTQSQNNMKMLSLAMLNSTDVYTKLPDTAMLHPVNKKPLLSWRVHLLPFLEQNELYEKFKKDEPWDSPTNKALIPMMPKLFASPSADLSPGMTTYLATTGPGTVFENGTGKRMREITDGTSRTFWLVEVDADNSVEWTRPADFELDQSNVYSGLLGTYEDGFIGAFCDGSIKFVAKSIDADALRAMFTCAAGD